MTRKKKRPPQSKHHQVIDSSGWTHVVRGPKGSLDSVRLSTVEPPNTTVEAFTKNFQSKCLPLWQESSCLQSLHRLFEQSILPRKDLTVNKIVCLGLGSLTAGGLTSCYEFAALLSILELLRELLFSSFRLFRKLHHINLFRYAEQKKGKSHIIKAIIFQDPVFNTVDKIYLATHGFTIVDDPQAFSEIDNETFVFAPHLEVAQIAAALETERPAIFIGNNLDGYGNG